MHGLITFINKMLRDEDDFSQAVSNAEAKMAVPSR
jgi:hypothetical protein